jgi:mono/diheme cytochrome c family protein
MVMRRLADLAAGAALAAIAGAAWAQRAAPAAGDVKAGHGVYMRDGCYECHGTTGQGGGLFGPKLAPDPLAFTAFAFQVRRPRAVMPVYTSKVLSDAELADIYAYLKTMPQPRPWQGNPLLNVK